MEKKFIITCACNMRLLSSFDWVKMGKIYCIMGKSSTGKDTIYKKLLEREDLGLHKIVPYTTRPIREGEQDGVEYHFTDVSTMEQFHGENRIIECRAYHTVHGIWYYYMVKDAQIDLLSKDYLIIGTLESYIMVRDYFGESKVVPIYIEIEDGERLSRALCREKTQSEPKYEEMCRRFLADCEDFSEEKLMKTGISTRFRNDNLENCIEQIIDYMKA